VVCKLEQVPLEIWMTLPVEAKKCLLNERKRQQQEDDIKKMTSTSGSKDTTKISDKDENHFNIPNQYANVKNSLKGEEEIQADKDNTYGFIDEYLREAIKTWLYI
jgi:hypothetical protein